MWSTLYFCPIFMKLEFFRQFFLNKIPWKSAQWELKFSMRTEGQTDRYDEAYSRFS